MLRRVLRRTDGVFAKSSSVRPKLIFQAFSTNFTPEKAAKFKILKDFYPIIFVKPKNISQTFNISASNDPNEVVNEIQRVLLTSNQSERKKLLIDLIQSIKSRELSPFGYDIFLNILKKESRKTTNIKKNKFNLFNEYYPIFYNNLSYFLKEKKTKDIFLTTLEYLKSNSKYSELIKIFQLITNVSFTSPSPSQSMSETKKEVDNITKVLSKVSILDKVLARKYFNEKEAKLIFNNCYGKEILEFYYNSGYKKFKQNTVEFLCKNFLYFSTTTNKNNIIKLYEDIFLTTHSDLNLDISTIGNLWLNKNGINFIDYSPDTDEEKNRILLRDIILANKNIFTNLFSSSSSSSNINYIYFNFISKLLTPAEKYKFLNQKLPLPPSTKSESEVVLVDSFTDSIFENNDNYQLMKYFLKYRIEERIIYKLLPLINNYFNSTKFLNNMLNMNKYDVQDKLLFLSYFITHLVNIKNTPLIQILDKTSISDTVMNIFSNEKVRKYLLTFNESSVILYNLYLLGTDLPLFIVKDLLSLQRVNKNNEQKEEAEVYMLPRREGKEKEIIKSSIVEDKSFKQLLTLLLRDSINGDKSYLLIEYILSTYSIKDIINSKTLDNLIYENINKSSKFNYEYFINIIYNKDLINILINNLNLITQGRGTSRILQILKYNENITQLQKDKIYNYIYNNLYSFLVDGYGTFTITSYLQDDIPFTEVLDVNVGEEEEKENVEKKKRFGDVEEKKEEQILTKGFFDEIDRYELLNKLFSDEYLETLLTHRNVPVFYSNMIYDEHINLYKENLSSMINFVFKNYLKIFPAGNIDPNSPYQSLREEQKRKENIEIVKVLDQPNYMKESEMTEEYKNRTRFLGFLLLSEEILEQNSSLESIQLLSDNEEMLEALVESRYRAGMNALQIIVTPSLSELHKNPDREVKFFKSYLKIADFMLKKVFDEITSNFVRDRCSNFIKTASKQMPSVINEQILPKFIKLAKTHQIKQNKAQVFVETIKDTDNFEFVFDAIDEIDSSDKAQKSGITLDDNITESEIEKEELMLERHDEFILRSFFALYRAVGTEAQEKYNTAVTAFNEMQGNMDLMEQNEIDEKLKAEAKDEFALISQEFGGDDLSERLKRKVFADSIKPRVKEE